MTDFTEIDGEIDKKFVRPLLSDTNQSFCSNQNKNKLLKNILYFLIAFNYHILVQYKLFTIYSKQRAQ